MIDDRTKMLVETVRKLFRRGARHNIQRILVKTHKADIAAMLEGFEPDDRLEIFKLEPSWEKRAEILSYWNKDLQKEMLARLDKNEVIKLVPLMDTDDAADLLGHLPEEEAREILSAMHREDSEEVADLMGYPEDSAGGLMSSEYLGLDQMLTVEDAIHAIQKDEDSARILFYIYVTDDTDHLVGVVSLKQLLLSRRSERLKDLMTTEVVSVTLDTPSEDVAKIVERYDFLSLPVVDNNNKIEGVITVDDVIDVIREEAEEDLLALGQAGWDLDLPTLGHFRARLPWLLLAFIAGTICFSLVYFFGLIQHPNGVDRLWLIAAYIPLLLALGGTTGSQSATVAVSALRAGHLDPGKPFKQLQKEMRLSLLFAVLFGSVIFGLGRLIFPSHGLSLILAAATALQIFVAMAVGALTPIGISRVGAELTFASVPVFTAIADVAAIAILFGMLHAFG